MSMRPFCNEGVRGIFKGVSSQDETFFRSYSCRICAKRKEQGYQDADKTTVIGEQRIIEG